MTGTGTPSIINSYDAACELAIDDGTKTDGSVATLRVVRAAVEALEARLG